MMAAFLHVLQLLPLWAWWILFNLSAGAWVVLAQVPELQSRRRSVELSVRLAVLAGLMLVGGLVALVLTAVERIERATFRKATEGSLT